MFAVYECVTRQHDLSVAGLAGLLWVVGSLTFFFLLRRSRECSRRRAPHWIFLSALAAGVGVWATHFVAMLAYRGSMPVTFDVRLTILSIGVCVLFFFAALRLYGRTASNRRSAAAGAVAALGVAAMHFTGMAAIIAPARLTYDPALVVAALVVSALGFAGAFIAFDRLTGWRQILVAACCAQLAVIGLHFTAMAATVFVPDGRVVPQGGFVGSQWLVGAILLAAAAVILLIAAAAVLDRLLTDLRGFADASLEGIAIVRDGRVLESNARFAEMVGVGVDRLIGSSPSEWLVELSGRPLLSASDATVEAHPVLGDVEQVFEVASHTIEYRGRDCQVLAVRDLTEKKRALREIEHMARHDALTALCNRAFVEQRLKAAFAERPPGAGPFALLALDLDRFKAVNDVFGHAVGDKVLCRVARILQGVVRPRDVVARVGGDEFLILQNDGPQPAAAQALVRRILTAFAEEMDVTLDPMAVGVSIGVSLSPGDADSAETMRHNADVALYRAKATGRGVGCFFDAAMDAEVRERRSLEQDVKHAAGRGELSLVFQPLVSTRDGEPVGYETLLRWSHPIRGDVPPALFVPIAEDTGAILAIGEWVLRRACEEALWWPSHLTLAVNVSPVQFHLADLAELVGRVLTETGFPARRLELEVTEGVLLRNKEKTLRMLHRIKALGVRIAMDDFGTGYSSLSNLHSFPFDKIKIDRSFIAALETDDAARSIVRAIIGLGRGLDLPVVAEGVETAAQQRLVAEEGCALAQGYLFGRPGAVARNHDSRYSRRLQRAR